MASEKSEKAGFVDEEFDEPPPPYESAERQDAPDQPAAPGMKKYNMYYTTSRTNVTLHLGKPSTPALYYCQSKIFFRKEPRVYLREGGSDSGPIVSFAILHFTSRHLIVGCGDYEKEPEGSLICEDLTRDKNLFRHSNYEFATSIGSSMRQAYVWKRDTGKFWGNIYLCYNQEGQVIAAMRSGGMLNWAKGGEIEVAENLDKKLEEFLMAAALGIWAAESGASFSKGYQSGEASSSAQQS